ncbi:SAF domain-containing protein [Desulforamulus putei]|uniref:SAF domain-containing protein n=1 Tax=Desulforamulus putei TaxID=74701 RepID=UPI002FDEF494
MFQFKKPNVPKLVKPKSKNKTILLGSIIIGLIAAVGIYFSVMSFIHPVNVVVAARDIDTMRKITEADVAVKKMSARSVHPKAYHDLKSVIGTYPKMPITAGEQILSTKLVNNPDKVVDAFEALQPDEMILELKEGKNIAFPTLLKRGDYVTFYSVEEDDTKEYGKGSKFISSSGPNLIHNFNNLSAGKDPTEGKIVVICTREEGKKILNATQNAKMIYVAPEHPENLIITPGKNVAAPK